LKGREYLGIVSIDGRIDLVYENVKWIHMAENRPAVGCYELCNELSGSIKKVLFLVYISEY
jgi:hypothetical protein